MRLVADSGLWRTGSPAAPAPLAAVLEVSGAVLSWTVDDPAAAVQIAFTDLPRADWLWRVLGTPGHVALAAAANGRPAEATEMVELAGVDVPPGPVEPLRRLAVGHWLRRWWPASQIDGIAALDRALLEGELAVLTAAAQDFFTDDTLDSDVKELLAPHAAALGAHLATGDPRVVDLVRACADLADDVGAGWPEPLAAQAHSQRRREDYALAAGAGAPSAAGIIAGGRASIGWSAVPPAIFDAAEDTVEWAVEVAGPEVVAVVRAAVTGPHPATGVAVRLRCGAISGDGVLDAPGTATLRLVDAQRRPITESEAWDHDWSTTSVVIGADVEESADTRERIRRFARARLAQPATDAFLAEILAAESDY